MNARGANRRNESSGPSGATGGSTTLSLDPSASRASTIGAASSMRRPADATSRAHASRSASASANRADTRCSRPRRSTQTCSGPFTSTSSTLGSASSGPRTSGATSSSDVVSEVVGARAWARAHRVISRSPRAWRPRGSRTARPAVARPPRPPRATARRCCTIAQSGSPHPAARPFVAPRWCGQTRAATTPIGRSPTPRRCSSAARRTTPRLPWAPIGLTIDDRRRSLEGGQRLDADPAARIDDAPKLGAHDGIEHLRDTALVHEVGLLGQRGSRQHPRRRTIRELRQQLSRVDARRVGEREQRIPRLDGRAGDGRRVARGEIEVDQHAAGSLLRRRRRRRS